MTFYDWLHNNFCEVVGVLLILFFLSDLLVTGICAVIRACRERVCPKCVAAEEKEDEDSEE